MLSLCFLLIYSKSQLTLILSLNNLRRNFEIVVPGVAHNRMANGILGLLCKRHYPGAMDIAGVRQPASSWEHYIAALDAPDTEGRAYDNKAHRVLSELWVSLHGTTFTKTSYSLHIFEIMTLYWFLCMISIDARRK